jgi:hypothetical protein
MTTTGNEHTEDDDNICTDCLEPIEEHCELCQECDCVDGECEDEDYEEEDVEE